VHRHRSRLVLLNIDEDAPWLTEPLVRLTDDVGIDWADTGPRLGALRGQGVRLRLPRDPHWNPQGHAVIADVLRERCARRRRCPGAAAEPVPAGAGRPVVPASRSLWPRRLGYNPSPMVKVGIGQLRDHVSRYVRRAEHGETIVIVNRDREVAMLQPCRRSRPRAVRLVGCLKGTAQIKGDIVGPLIPEAEWFRF
jgi:prevent-host-death family protein